MFQGHQANTSDGPQMFECLSSQIDVLLLKILDNVCFFADLLGFGDNCLRSVFEFGQMRPNCSENEPIVVDFPMSKKHKA